MRFFTYLLFLLLVACSEASMHIEYTYDVNTEDEIVGIDPKFLAPEVEEVVIVITEGNESPDGAEPDRLEARGVPVGDEGIRILNLDLEISRFPVEVSGFVTLDDGSEESLCRFGALVVHAWSEDQANREFTVNSGKQESGLYEGFCTVTVY